MQKNWKLGLNYTIIGLIGLGIGYWSKTSCHSHAQALSSVLLDSETDVFIPKDTANKMISNYLTSLEGDTNAIKSFLVNGDALRKYLNQDTSIRQLKISLAHPLTYINDSNGVINGRIQSGTLTIIISGVDGSGNYALFNGNTVMNKALICPHVCLHIGTAANDLIE